MVGLRRKGEERLGEARSGWKEWRGAAAPVRSGLGRRDDARQGEVLEWPGRPGAEVVRRDELLALERQGGPGPAQRWRGKAELRHGSAVSTRNGKTCLDVVMAC